MHLAESNRDVHASISRALETCASGIGSTMGELYGDVMRNGRASWLEPALQRLHWNLRENPDGARWGAYFGPLINVLFRTVAEVSEADLCLLCEHAGFLAEHHCHTLVEKMASFAWKLERSAGLSAFAIDQMRSVEPEARLRASWHAHFLWAWTLFRAANNSDDGDPCWSAMVRRDLRALSQRDRDAWLKLLDMNDHAHMFPAGLPAQPCAELSRFNRSLFETSVSRWTRFLVEADPPVLGFAGLTLLNFLLRLCHAQPDAAVDEALYHVATARWEAAPLEDEMNMPEDGAWLPAYLMALSNRPTERAFACAEALALNPFTQEFGEVEGFYRSVANAATRVPQVRQFVAIDGFPIDPLSELALEHTLLDDLLRAAHPDQRRKLAGPSLDPLQSIRESIILRKPGRLPAFIKALSERSECLKDRKAAFPEEVWLRWSVELDRSLGCALANLPGDPDSETIIAALRADRINQKGHGCTRESWRLLEICRQFVNEHGW